MSDSKMCTPMLNQLIKRGMKPRGVLCLDSRLDHVFLITQLDAISEKVWQRLSSHAASVL